MMNGVDIVLTTFEFNNRVILDVSMESLECSIVSKNFSCVYQYEEFDITNTVGMVVAKIMELV